MRPARRSLILVLLIAVGAGLRASQQTTPTASLQLSPPEMEAFLLKARISSRRDAGGGVTNSSRVTLSDGRITHDAHLQTVDIAQNVFQAGKATELNFKDTYRYNIAGYR
jgi:hypothetical protein